MPNNNENGSVESITIPKSCYEELLKSEKKLCALERAGVDNWEGYGYAMESLDE